MSKAGTLVSFNLMNSSSTGKIMMQVASLAKTKGYETYQVYPDNRYGNPPISGDLQICSGIQHKIFQRFCRHTGLDGCTAFFATLRILRKLDKIQPTVIQMHNMHSSYINLPLLFRYIKRHHIPVVWTLHDCWTFTGHCPYFSYAGCEKWKTGCYGCTLYRKYPKTEFDNSKMMYRLKKKWFTGVENLTIVTPSQWLANLAKQSYMKEYPVQVINNGIDLSVFRPVQSNVREKYGIARDEKMLLAVAFGWGAPQKNVDVIIALAKQLPKDYRIVMVGAFDGELPENVIFIDRTNNQQELAELYGAADLFVLPSREENYPTVVMEAVSCGTPVVMYDAGGSAEIINEKTGVAVPCDDYDALYQEIIRICQTMPFDRNDCLERAKSFDMNQKHEEYVQLYDAVTGVIR